MAALMSNNTTLQQPAGNRTMDEPYMYSKTYKIVSTTVIFTVMTLAIFGNTLVITSFRRFHKLRSVTNYFVVSLAVADILISSTSMPIWAAHIVTGPDPKWEKIDVTARVIWTFMDIICGLASIFNLTCISIERYICISSPLRYYQRLGGRRALTLIIFIWCSSFILAGARVVFRNYPPPFFELFYSVVGFFVPLLIMVGMYSMIFRVACKQVKKMDIPMDGKTKKFRLRKEIKAAKTLGIVIGAFFVCWSPFFVLNTLVICKPCRGLVRIDVIIAVKWFHYINSVLNPLIYARMNRDFREAFTRILLKWAIALRLRTDDTEAELQRLDRRSSVATSTLGKRRRSSYAIGATSQSG